MSALNRKLRALAFSGKARSMAAADSEAFVRDRERAAAGKAWDEGYWQGINGHTGPGNPYRDKDDIVNRKAVQ